jgi:hypothetical protein
VSTLGIVLLVVVVLLVLLVAGGLAISRRRARAQEGRLRAEVQAANEALASAHAEDKGWHRERLEQAARDAFAQRSSAPVRELQLVQVVDRPGTDQDKAVFRVDRGSERLTLGRRDGQWVLEALE